MSEWTAIAELRRDGALRGERLRELRERLQIVRSAVALIREYGLTRQALEVLASVA
jgi:hypothetical protein